jgi:outer membrane protein TolC
VPERRLRLTFAIALVVACSAPALAQPPVPLTLDEAIARAMTESHQLAELVARQQGAHAAVAARRAADNPSVGLAGGYTRTNHVDEFGVPQPDGRLRVIYPDIPDNFFTRASLQWPIYTGGRVDALVRAAEAEARAAAADLEAARADLRLEVTRVYWALVTAGETVRVLEEALARADAHLRDVRSRFDAGLVPPNEVTAVDAQRARQQMQLIEAQSTRRSVLEDLQRLTGLAGEIAPVEPLDRGSDVKGDSAANPGDSGPGSGAPNAAGASLKDSSLSELRDFTFAVARGQTATRAPARPEQEALQARIAAADARIDAARAARHPTLSLFGNADYANPNPRIFPRMDVWRSSWEAGIQATWTLWDGGRSAAEAAEADAAARALRARRADLDARIATEIRQRQLDVEAARAAIAAAEAAVQSAAETRRVTGERFAVGVATSTDVLDAQVALLQAELDRTRALANLRLAEARLARAMGR